MQRVTRPLWAETVMTSSFTGQGRDPQPREWLLDTGISAPQHRGETSPPPTPWARYEILNRFLEALGLPSARDTTKEDEATEAMAESEISGMFRQLERRPTDVSQNTAYNVPKQRSQVHTKTVETEES